jgi:plastocyanin
MGFALVGRNVMTPRLRSLAIVLACGIMAVFVLTPSAAAQRASRPGRIIGATVPYNPFVNLPLTPFIGVGQFMGIQNTLAYASLFGRLPPGPNPFLNYALTPDLSVGQAAFLSALSGGAPFLSPQGIPIVPPVSPALYGGGGGFPGYGGGGYGAPYSGGYGTTPAYGSGGYGMMSTHGGSNAYGNTQQLATKTTPSNALDALRTHGGGLDWPVGLRLLEPKDDSKTLRQEIDETVVTMFRQPNGTETTAKLLDQLSGDIEKLDRMYRAHVWDMALTRQQEEDVRRFVHKVRDALVAAKESGQLYAQSQLNSGSQANPKEQQGPGEVGVYDNYFEPKSIEIAAGTKVRWKSHGAHMHTVTADNDEWRSLDLGAGKEVTVTLNKPGTYHYHCNVHPKEMRGTIIVK